MFKNPRKSCVQFSDHLHTFFEFYGIAICHMARARSQFVVGFEQSTLLCLSYCTHFLHLNLKCIVWKLFWNTYLLVVYVPRRYIFIGFNKIWSASTRGKQFALVPGKDANTPGPGSAQCALVWIHLHPRNAATRLPEPFLYPV